MAWGIPVISSNATSLPEVGGDEALYFDPTSPEELAVKLAQVAQSGMPEGWSDRARARAARFSWRASLEGIFSVYQELLERRERGREKVPAGESHIRVRLNNQRFVRFV